MYRVIWLACLHLINFTPTHARACGKIALITPPLSPYICIHAHIINHTYTHIHVYIYTCKKIVSHVHVFNHTYTYAHAHTYTCTHVKGCHNEG